MAFLISGPFAVIVNFVQRTWPFRKLMDVVVGIDMRRKLPEYSRVRFTRLFKKRKKRLRLLKRKVVLFNDTNMNYHQPGIGTAAVELLESCGYEVILANAGCCQRPKISHGFLREAKKKGLKTLENLDKFIQQGLKVVVCEPSCCSALTDDLPDLIDDVELGRRIKQNVMMIDNFLADELRQGRLRCDFTSPFRKIIIHPHCHQKALFGTDSMKYVLEKVPAMSVEILDTGCCGMAGSFGFEKEHYELSMEIGEDRLFPAVRKRSTGSVIVACGLSCRDQIRDGTGAEAMHWVQTIRGRNVRV